MIKNNFNRWISTKLQIDEIILTVYTDLSKRSATYINELGCPHQYIADMFRDLAEGIINSYPELKGNSSDL